ncbi:hypothetical protein FM120_20395 [Sphingobacterium faecium PCAi_F2.5]|nr:hypothetical protein FM120_20395 [Sphingobacterium faecium PCAi_F2.5]
MYRRYIHPTFESIIAAKQVAGFELMDEGLMSLGKEKIAQS